MPFVNGKWIHHNDCFWCTQYREIPAEIKKGQVKKVNEYCELRQIVLPPPLSEGRLCENYTQKGCGCEKCQPVAVMLQVENGVDKCAIP